MAAFPCAVLNNRSIARIKLGHAGHRSRAPPFAIQLNLDRLCDEFQLLRLKTP